MRHRLVQGHDHGVVGRVDRGEARRHRAGGVVPAVGEDGLNLVGGLAVEGIGVLVEVRVGDRGRVGIGVNVDLQTQRAIADVAEGQG